jgi:hypothetical protein
MTPDLQTFAPAKHQRLDLLLEKNAEGPIFKEEESELTALVAEAEQVMIANARQMADVARSQASQPPPAAIPVTVWVIPQSAES